MQLTTQQPDNLATRQRVSAQWVYRREFAAEIAVQTRDDAKFMLMATPWHLLSVIQSAIRLFGVPGAVKAVIKLATHRRLLYVVTIEGRIANYGWISVSFCRYYRVERDDVIFGPVATRQEFRGRGLATFGLQCAINAMMRRGHRVFFIDTSEHNLAMQKVITACGFGAPTSSYSR